MAGKIETIEDYIAASPKGVRGVLRKMRGVIRAAAPKAEEVISYRMPAFRLAGGGKMLVYFAAFKKHIGMYPPVRDKKLLAAVKKYAGPKRNLQFPLDEPIPYGLVTRIVKMRVKEVTGK